MSRTLSVGLTHVSFFSSKLLSDPVRSSKATHHASISRSACSCEHHMVQAAAADAANILIPLSVEAVGQMQFSTAMVQQPVPARQNSFLGKLRWMPRLVGGARQAATRTNPWGMLLCADSPCSLLVAGLKSAPSGRDIVTVFQPPYSQPLVASLSTRQRFRTSKVPHGCGL